MAALPSCVECASLAGFTCSACRASICDIECGALHARRAHPRDRRGREVALRRWRDPTYRARTVAGIRAGWRQRGGLTAEERARRGAESRARWEDPAFRDRMRQASRRSWAEHSGGVERRAAYAEAWRRRWRDPTYRARMLAARQAAPRAAKDDGRRGVASTSPARPV